jgi:hypothetical protein
LRRLAESKQDRIFGKLVQARERAQVRHRRSGIGSLVESDTQDGIRTVSQEEHKRLGTVQDERQSDDGAGISSSEDMLSRLRQAKERAKRQS